MGGHGNAHAHKRRGRTSCNCASCKMASSFAWLSVMIKQNQKVVRPRTVVKCSWEDTFEMLLGKLKMQAEITVEKVEICSNEKFVDAHVVPQ